MKIITSERYGVRIIGRLAYNEDKTKKPTTLTALAEDENVSRSYAAVLLAKLCAAGIVKSIKGPLGGYRLARPAKMITFLEVIEAVEEKICLFKCLSEPKMCRHSKKCRRRELCEKINTDIKNVFAGYTVDLMMHYSDNHWEEPWCPTKAAPRTKKPLSTKGKTTRKKAS